MDQQLGDVAGEGQEAGQAQRDRALVAQETQIPRGVADLLRDLAVGEEAAVGLGGVGELAQQGREELALNGGGAGDAAGERGQVAQGPGRVGEAQGGEAGAGGVGRQAQLLGRDAGDRLQQRAVEELRVQAADLAGVADPLGAEGLDGVAGGVGAVAEGVGEPPQSGRVVGDGVGAAEALQLQAVLDDAQEAVGAQQGIAVGQADVAALDQGAQGLQGGRRAQGVVGAAVHELEQLHGELDVAQAAGTALDLAVDLGARDGVDDAAAHGPDLVDGLGALGGGPDQRLQLDHPRRAELEVAGGRAGLQQRLELPGLGPLAVVGQVRGDGPHQRAAATLRAQRGVDRPGHEAADLHQAGGQGAAGPHGGLDVDALGGLGDEDHVDVADIVELAAAALAHRDDGQAAGRAALLRLGDGERGPQGGVGELRQAAHGDLDVGGRGQVGGHDPDELPAVAAAQQRDRRDVAGAVAGGALVLLADQLAPLVGVGDEQVAEGRGDAEDADQAAAQGLVLYRTVSRTSSPAASTSRCSWKRARSGSAAK